MLTLSFQHTSVLYTLAAITTTKVKTIWLLNIKIWNGPSLAAFQGHDMLTVQSKWIRKFIFSVDTKKRKTFLPKNVRKFQEIISAILKSGRILDIWRHQVIKGPYWTNLMIMSSSPTIMEKFYESITTSVIYWISENAMRN